MVGRFDEGVCEGREVSTWRWQMTRSDTIAMVFLNFIGPNDVLNQTISTPWKFPF